MQPLVSEIIPVTKTEAPPKKLDLSHVAPPENVEEMRIEEITIDGICGVY
ncbi:MAG: mycofactocin precursor [SAR324 cluster bacterium]|nr:mycofactocin precursor [SAR324 cluster bacterium]